MPPLRILQVASELAPLAKTGGLADVVAALSHELATRGHQVRVMVPLHRAFLDAGVGLAPVPGLEALPLELGPRRGTLSVRRAIITGQAAEVWCLHCPEMYDRPGIYTAGADEPLRFAVLCRAALAACQQLGWAPDVVHAHDWHAAWLPLQVRLLATWDQLFAHTRTVLTIHNIGYQGSCDAGLLGDLGLGDVRQHLDPGDLVRGRINPLKTGVRFADAVTTVSETYAREILGPEQGMGLEGALAARPGGVVGIVNGIDDQVWSPEHDVHIPVRYTADTLDRKVANTSALLQRFRLLPKGAGPVFGIVSRLAWQKGFDLFFDTLPQAIAQHDARLVVLGSGESRYAMFFEQLARHLPGRVALYNGFSEELAHLVEAGADAFLMPSRYEPCGLNQMYSQRYGTVPVVHRTGGLADTVEQYDPETRRGTGILFDHFDVAGLGWALDTTVALHAAREHWRALMVNGMARDFSWRRQAQRYVQLFEGLRDRSRAPA